MNPSRRARYDLFVDTAGFFAVANDGDPYHGEASATLRRAAQERLRVVTTNFVVAETHALMTARVGPAVALHFVQALQAGTISVERVTPGDEAAALQILRRYDDKSFSYTDATSFAVMTRLGVQLALTSDRHFLQFGFEQARG